MTIDGVERPDLVAELAGGRLTHEDCRGCTGLIERPVPLLITRLDPKLPLLAAFPGDYTGEEPLSDLDDIANETRRRLGALVRDVPSPVLVVPFEVASTASSRDVSADLHAAEEIGFNAVAGDAYGQLLEGIVDSDVDRRVDRALTALRSIGGRDDYDRLLTLVTDDIADRVATQLDRALPDAEDGSDREAALLHSEVWRWVVAGDIERGWATFENGVAEFWQNNLAQRETQLVEQLSRAREEHDLVAFADAGQALLELMSPGSASEWEAELSHDVASALANTPSLDGEQTETVIELYERVLDFLDRPATPEDLRRRAGTLMNLGGAYRGRAFGDPVANLERSERMLREAVGILEQTDANSDVLAMAWTNLALILLERSENAAEAVPLLRAALQHRALEHDPLGFAFTNLNLGLAYQLQSEDRGANSLSAAVDCCRDGLLGAATAGDADLVAQLHHNLSCFLEGLAASQDAGTDNRAQLLVESEQHARLSLASRPGGATDAGRTRLHLARLLARQHRDFEAADEYRTALSNLEGDPDAWSRRDAAWELAVLLTRLGRADQAADAWDVAATAGIDVLDRRAATDTRLQELARTTTLFRFASHALATAGRCARAVEVIESGRGREIRIALQRTSVDVDRLEYLNPELAHRFAEARLRVEQIDAERRRGITAHEEDADRAAAMFRTALAEVRAEPGLESEDTTTVDEVAAAAEPTVPIAYLLAAPEGCGTLVIEHEGSVTFAGTDQLTSADVVTQMIGDPAGPAAYLNAQTFDPTGIHDAVRGLEPTIGELLLNPLARHLRDAGATGVCLVATGLLGLLPLHALRWREDGDTRCLLDEFDVTFAPSAWVRRTAVARAAAHDRASRRLLAVGNPLPSPAPLPGAETEVAAIAATFDGASTVLLRHQATRSRVLFELGHATHVHLACHGSAGILDEPFTAALSLAGSDLLTAPDIMSSRIEARLVVASACQTGVVQGYEAVDETLGISSAFLAAGAAGVVSSLWQVDDYATDVTMTRFYELLLDDHSPASALRMVQQWLRQLTWSQIEEYVQSRDALRHRAQPSHARQDATDGTRPSGPWSTYDVWAAFVLNGA